MEMKSGRGLQEDEDDDEEEFVSKKGGSSQKDGRGSEQKANTPRSKHSATEQRRRSKINDRFQILRDLIPQNDQKRDKASFLLEVIEYIQFLQEKVHKYEGTYQGWNQEPMKLTPWRNGHGHGESMADHSRTIKNGPGPALMFPGKFNDNSIPITPAMLANTQNPMESDMSNSTPYKPVDQPGLADNIAALPIPMQTTMLNSISPVTRVGGPIQAPQRLISDLDNTASQPQPQLWQTRPCAPEYPVASENMNEQEDLGIEGGTISIAGVYSQGLLNNLTQALQSSGVDLTQASISVQVDLGKRAASKLNAISNSAKDHEDPSSNRAMAHSRDGSSGEDSDQAQKRFKSE